MLMKRTDGLRFSRTRRVFLTFSAVAMIVAAAIGSYTGRAGAEAGGQQGPQQVQLTGKQVEQYLAAFKELTPLFEKCFSLGSGQLMRSYDLANNLAVEFQLNSVRLNW